jgi:hypothetical protein
LNFHEIGLLFAFGMVFCLNTSLRHKEDVMSKRLVVCIVLLFIGWSLYSCFPSILQYQIEPTEEQKAEFFRKAREDPELYSFNPMHAGNIWWYTRHWFGDPDIDPPFIGRQVVDSTFIEGNKYYMMNPSFSAPYGFWIRNIDDTTILWDQHNEEYLNDLDDDPQTYTLVNQDFTITATTPEEAPWIWPVDDGQWYPYKCILYSTGWMDFFGFISQFIYYDYLPLYPSLFYDTVWLRGIGPVYRSTDSAETWLEGCIIDGITYGNIPSSIQEDTLTPGTPPIELEAYPNPFVNGVTVKTSSPNPIKGLFYEVYNIRGQIVTSQIIEDNTVYWDGIDMNGQMTSPGLYILKVSYSNGISKSINLMHL